MESMAEHPWRQDESSRYREMDVRRQLRNRRAAASQRAARAHEPKPTRLAYLLYLDLLWLMLADRRSEGTR